MIKATILCISLACFLFGVMPANAVITWIGSDRKTTAPDVAMGSDGMIWLIDDGSIWQRDISKPPNQQLTRFAGNRKPAVLDKKAVH